MGIQIEWEIESEQREIRSAGEDPESRRQRRRRRLRILLLLAIVLGFFAFIVAFFILRLRQVDDAIEQELRDTVDAEVAMLRIGDLPGFISVQQSATEDWELAQRAYFDSIQRLKVEQDVQLPGHILDLEIDGRRARVHVQEIINNVPYERVWFYWRFLDEGWLHVPPDYTFWGESGVLESDGVRVQYMRVDDTLAAAIHERLRTWREVGCNALMCDGLSTIKVEIVPNLAQEIVWSPTDPWQMIVPSPYTTVARADRPLDSNLEFELAELMAERLVQHASGNFQPVYPADAFYLRQAVESWLVGRFAGINTNSFMVNSLATLYGDEAVGRLLAALQPDSTIAVINQVVGTSSIDQTGLDWRDVLTWRLNTENELIARRDEDNFLALYDTRDDASRNVATSRFNAGASGETAVVQSAVVENSADGVPQLRAIARMSSETTSRDEEILFRLVDGVWRRVN
ncbi:MAG: hypothetical protein D6737_15660 [Chloroflexi bacterium]|nr:MAG: hypothetical protein D6737_15660 [Chloroflexota bacterium]